KEKMFLASSLEFAEISGLNGQVLTIAFPQKFNFYKENLEHPENKKLIEDKAKEVFRQDLRVNFILDKNLREAAPPVETRKAQEGSLEDSPESSIIQSALDIFQGRIIKRSSS
ncbi:MAG: hypothetical protein JW714_00410, partial [Candidatus Omnitrophica bacterium]|nr:hypothetical protein [Candidatus Omnitrophota bacterium]